MALTKDRFVLRKDLTTLAASRVISGARVELDSGERFLTGAVDGGNGIELVDGNFANPIIETVDLSFLPITVATALSVDSRSISTVTNTHTMADGVDVGDTIDFTWKDGTIATIQAVSNISFTDKDDVTTVDTEWVFDFPIVELTFVWTGSQWEIK